MGLQAPGEGQDALSALPLAALRRIFEYLRPRDLCLVERICTYRPPNHRNGIHHSFYARRSMI
jgi:hypothetical protein